MTEPVVAQPTVSDDFTGRWHKLVSTSNWEKGRIIYEWKNALIDEGAGPGDYSDEAWSHLVGTVTPQHVGRLRRVYKRFFTSYPSYEGLYWSHFHAAIDWDDAELWLEGAVQNRWSISQMRKQRWEASGAVESDKPDDKDIVTGEVDEDVDLAISGSVETIENLDKRDPKQAESGAVADFEPFDDGEEDLDADAEPEVATAEPVRPFAELPELPDDLADAFDAFKLAILRHKTADWDEIEQNDILKVLDSLKLLVEAPSEANAS